MVVFRYPTRLLICDEFTLYYRTEDGIKSGSVRFECGCEYETDHEQTLGYIQRYYKLKKANK